jgi:predicted AAA+ superfamily ATPase
VNAEIKHPLEKNLLFGRLPLELSENLRMLNPWWVGEPGPPLPAFQRWPFKRMLRLLRTGLAPGTVLRGSRRVGKTTLLRQAIHALLSEGVEPKRILYIAFDDLPTLRGIKEPILSIARWFEREILGESFNTAITRGFPAFLLFDEVQNLDSWAPQIKHLVDNHGVRVLVTGSSSLRIEAGRDSLAGRITTLEIGPLQLREIAELRFKESTSSLWGENGLDFLLRPEFWLEAAKGKVDQPIELRLKRKKSPAKICLSDHSLRASRLQEVIPIDPAGLADNPHLSDLAGHMAESTLGYFLGSIPNLDVSHFPTRGTEPEVDFIITIGTQRIPVEVKYHKRIDNLEDTRGLRAFLEKSVYNAPFGLLVTLEDGVRVSDPRIIPLSLSSFLWAR